MRRDLSDNLQVSACIPCTRVASDNTAIVSSTVDMLGYNSLMIAIATGTLADADATFTALLEESSDNSTFTTPAAGDLVGTAAGASFTFTHDNAVRKIGYIGAKRYVRLTITPASNTGTADISAVAILGNARLLPKTTQS